MSSTTTESQIEILQAAITDKPPYCHGVCAIPAESFILYYGRDAVASRVDLSTASDSELENLSRNCQPATFGVNQKDVLDESYRKAGKLDTAHFSSKFNLEHLGLLEFVRSALLDGHDGKKTIEAELYKLNVYGKDSFFKSHKDTPRGEKMFASLVIFFPTLHEGGELVLRHGGKEWMFDAAKEVATQSKPSIGYVAFYSDVEHEVLPVKSGYRVTMTYNLYFGSREPHISVAPLPSPLEVSFKAALSRLLDDPGFLPTGGNLGFGLRHEYPVQNTIKHLAGCLKGSDAVIKKVCTDLTLSCTLQIVYKHDGDSLMCDSIPDLGEQEVSEELSSLLASEYNAKRVLSDGAVARNGEYEGPIDTIPVWWVTRLTDFTSVENSYIAYGNEASMQYLYGRVCLVVHVGAPGSRDTPAE